MAETPTKAPAPAPAPAPNAAEIVTQVVALEKPDERRKKIAELIQAQTIDDLEVLAKEIKESEKLKDPVKLQEFREEIKKRIEALQQSKNVDQKLTMLDGKVTLLELLPELQKKKGLLERGTNTVVSGLGTVLGWFKGFGGWIGETTTSLSNYITDPENYAKIGRMIANGGKRVFFWLLKNPVVIGMPANIPLIGPLSAWANEQWTQMDVMDAIYQVVNEDKETGKKPPVTFDGNLDKAVWRRWKMEKNTPEDIQQMVQAYIDAQRQVKNGVGTEPIAITMAVLKKPEEAAKAAAETLQAELAKNIGVEKVTFGTSYSARKEGGKWSITIANADVDKTGKKLTDSSTAAKLVAATQKLTAVSEIVFEPNRSSIEITKQKVTLDSGKLSDIESIIGTIIEALPVAGPVATLRIGDTNLNPGAPIAKFENGTLAFSTNPSVMGLMSDTGKLSNLITLVNNKLPDANGTVWKYVESNGTWEEALRIAK